MNAVLSLENFSLLPKGPTITLRLAPGQSLCVLGPAASGKSKLLNTIRGEEKPGQGKLRTGRVAAASAAGFSRRTTPASIVKSVTTKPKSALAAESLYATELWDAREKPLPELTSSQQAGAELLTCLGADADLLLIDGQLDRLDPWTLKRVWRMLASRKTAFVAVTNRPELVRNFDLVLVLQRGQAKFLGSLEDLGKKMPPAEIRISTLAESSVEALTDTFSLRAEQVGGELILQTQAGQEVAAKFLLEGYGAVQAVGLAEPTPEDRILNLVKQP